MMTRETTLTLSAGEYAEVLAKLANELDFYDDAASESLKTGFMKLIKACPYDESVTMCTRLIIKHRNTLLKRLAKRI